MPNWNYASNKYKALLGTHSAEEMDNDDNAIVYFEIQPDMRNGLEWVPPIQGSSTVSQSTETDDAFDGSRTEYGRANFSWIFFVLTPLMIRYLRNRLFGGKTVTTAEVTVVTWDRSSGWRTLNCTALWNEPAKGADPTGLKGYYQLRIDFIEARDASTDGVILMENETAILMETGASILIEEPLTI